jgi:nitrate reductase assembly molybdenum cofactor insertion protein NarJ
MAKLAENLDHKSSAAVLASLISSYPADSFSVDVQALLADPSLSLPSDLRKILTSLCEDSQLLNAQRSAYIDLFDRGAAQNPIHETEWSRDRSLGKATQLADLAGFYKAFGVELGATGATKEMADHVAVELEFYAILLLKERALAQGGDTEGVEIVHDARRKFLKAHLGTFIGAVAALPDVAAHPTFGPIFKWCDELVAADCGDLGVTPTIVSRPDGKPVGEEDVVCCGVLAAATPPS